MPALSAHAVRGLGDGGAVIDDVKLVEVSRAEGDFITGRVVTHAVDMRPIAR